MRVQNYSPNSPFEISTGAGLMSVLVGKRHVAIRTRQRAIRERIGSELREEIGITVAESEEFQGQSVGMKGFTDFRIYEIHKETRNS